MIFGREQRQGLGRALPELLGRKPQVVEERGGIGIAFIELVPERSDARMVEIARRERGLAAPRRAGDPDHRARFTALIQHGEQPLPGERSGEARTCCLAERCPSGLPPSLLPALAAFRNAFAARVGAAAPAPRDALDAVHTAFQRRSHELVPALDEPGG